MNIPEDPDVPSQINIVPMIDVIFAILTFFIISTLFLTRSEGLPVNLPQAQTSESQQSDKIVVTIDEAGQMSLNKDPVAFEELASEVVALKGDRPNVLVTINADETVYHGIVVAVMDELRTIEGARLGIATQRPQVQEVE
ncbi:MAG: biopolymer transporter ExbD [Leptolyngbyaceae bacterium]|nr:biopolymer transporter ExbD [Leptolyngbyaceae bacterium]